MTLGQGWATIFVRGPHRIFICDSRAKSSQLCQFKANKIAFAGRMLPPPELGSRKAKGSKPFKGIKARHN